VPQPAYVILRQALQLSSVLHSSPLHNDCLNDLYLAVSIANEC
jgi:hypothetical protein